MPCPTIVSSFNEMSISVAAMLDGDGFAVDVLATFSAKLPVGSVVSNSAQAASDHSEALPAVSLT